MEKLAAVVVVPLLPLQGVVELAGSPGGPFPWLGRRQRLFFPCINDDPFRSDKHTRSGFLLFFPYYLADQDRFLLPLEEGFHGIDIGDFDAYITQKEMDHELPFRRLYGYDSDDEGPQEELDEDGSMNEENQIHFELTGLEKRTHLFRDLSLAHKVVVDGGMRKTTIEPTPCPDPGEPRDENEDENAYFKKGLKFPSLPAMKVWLSDYAIHNHMPFYVEHSYINLWFTMKCVKADEGCIWKVRAKS
ncbi:Protease 2 [Hordeum vulgare]|nr:Protease 2 [Hordeum vulgare]